MGTKRKTAALMSMVLSLTFAAASQVKAAPSPASGLYTTQSGLVNVLAFPSSSERASAFQIGLGQTVDTEVAYSDSLLRSDDPATPADESLNELWSFCVQPYELDASGNPTLTPAEFYINGNHSLVTDKILSAHNNKQVRYLMNKVPLYAKNGSLGAGAPVGLLSDRGSSSYVGTPVSTTASITVGSSTVTLSSRDLEYAAVSLAVRKILDPSLNLDNIDPAIKSILKTRAETYINDAATNSGSFQEPDTKNSYGVILDTQTTAGSIVVTVSALDGNTGAQTTLSGKTVRLWNQSLDLDQAAPGIQNQVTAVTDSVGKATFSLASIPSDTPAKVVLEKAIAPGTLVKTTGQVTSPSGSTTSTPAKAQQQMLATAGWGRVITDVIITKNVAETQPSTTTTPPTTPTTKASSPSLPGTGPDYSLLYLLLAVFFGVSGLYFARRPNI